MLPSKNILTYFKAFPKIDPSAHVSHNATVLGDVEMASGSSVWYDAVVRGDMGVVRIGKNSNVQDRVLIGSGNKNILNKTPSVTQIGEYVTIGHEAIIDRSQIGDFVLIGNGSHVGEGSVMETRSMLAAAAVLLPGTTVPTGQMWAGNPAKFVRVLTESELNNLKHNAEEYSKLAAIHRADITAYLNTMRAAVLSVKPEMTTEVNQAQRYDNECSK